MCGRFTMYENKDSIQKEFEVDIRGDLFKPSYNIAPTQDSLVMFTSENKRICTTMRWGLVPFWAKDIKIGYKMINARAETVDKKSSFRKPYPRGFISSYIFLYHSLFCCEGPNWGPRFKFFCPGFLGPPLRLFNDYSRLPLFAGPRP